MHPTPSFHWDRRDELLSFVAARAFMTLCASVEGELVAAQVPVIVHDNRASLLLHVSRANTVARALLGGSMRVLMVATGADAYVSPDWYADPHSVPTWNYVSVEIRGTLTATHDARLLEILALQSAEFEARIEGKTPWTIDKLPADVLAAKLKGIVGATLEIESIRGTRKLSQNKTDADREGVAAALVSSGRADDREIARLVRPHPLVSTAR